MDGSDGGWRVDRELALVSAIQQARATGDRGGERLLAGELVESMAGFLRKLVVQVASRAGCLSLTDLDQIAAIAMLKASGTFDPDRGQTFGQFAAYGVRRALEEQIRLHSADVCVSDAAARGRTVRQAQGKEGAAPTVAVVSKDEPKRNEESEDCNRSTSRGLEAAQRAYMALDDGHDSPEALYAEAEERQHLVEALDLLSPQDRDLVVRSYGLGGQAKQSARDICVSWGLPETQKSRVDRMLARAIAQLRDLLSDDEG